MSSQTTRAAIYVRVSSEEQASGGTSIATQEERCRAYCTAQGWTATAVYVDAGVSGALASRPALDRMLTAVHDGQVDAVLVAKLDRLSRSMGNLAPLLADLDGRGVALVSIAESFDSGSPAGRLMRNMLGSMAEWERDVIRERTMSGKRARVAGGGWSGGNHSPYGYKIVGEKAAAHLELDEREAAMIRRAVELLVDQGLTTGEAARALNVEGYHPRQAARWSAVNLRNVLVRGDWTGSWTYAKGSAEAIPVAIPPLLDVERAAALRQRLSATTRALPQRGRPYPLSGRLVGTCGHTFHGIGRADRTTVRYRCNLARDLPHREVRCPEPTVRAEEVEAAVWDAVLELLADPQRLMAGAAEHLGMLDEAASGERDALVRAKIEVDRRQEALVNASAAGLQAGLDAETLRQVVAKLQADLADSQHHLRQMAALQAETGAQRERVSAVQSLALVARERLLHADPALQQRILALLDVRVTILSHGEAGHRGRRGGPVQLRVEGSIAHDLLLANAESDWHPSAGATARA